MDTYYVTLTVTADYTAKVEASNVEEAYEKANHMMEDAEVGDLDNISWENNYIEDANGNRLG